MTLLTMTLITLSIFTPGTAKVAWLFIVPVFLIIMGFEFVATEKKVLDVD